MHCTIGNICTQNDYDKFEKPNGKTIVNVGIRDITILKVMNNDDGSLNQIWIFIF